MLPRYRLVRAVWFLIAVTICCCSSRDTTASPTADPASSRVVTGPAPQATALAGNAGVNQFALDIETGDIWTIRSDDAVSWLDDETLLAPHYGYGIIADRFVLVLKLDGSSRRINEMPASPTPFAVSTTSADGQWRVTGETSSLRIQRTDGAGSMALPTSENYAWSPRGHVLAIGGGRCGNVPVTFVDPDAAVVTHTVDVGSLVTRSWAWKPDGSGIAMAVLIDDDLDSRILFASASTAHAEVLVPMGRAGLHGEPSVGPWSPSGTRLLFTAYSGRPCPR